MRPGSKLRFFTEYSRTAWGFGLMIPYADRYALIAFGPWSVGVDW